MTDNRSRLQEALRIAITFCSRSYVKPSGINPRIYIYASQMRMSNTFPTCYRGEMTSMELRSFNLNYSVVLLPHEILFSRCSFLNTNVFYFVGKSWEREVCQYGARGVAATRMTGSDIFLTRRIQFSFSRVPRGKRYRPDASGRSSREDGACPRQNAQNSRQSDAYGIPGYIVVSPYRRLVMIVECAKLRYGIEIPRRIDRSGSNLCR